MTKDFKLSGLTCSNCASLIEEELSALPEVKEVSVNLMRESMRVDFAGNFDSKGFLNTVISIVQKHEPHVTVREDSLEHSHGHSHEIHDDSVARVIKLRIALGGLFFLIGLFAPLSPHLTFAAYLISYLIVGYDVVLQALKNLRYGRVFDEYFLMSLATIGAFIIREYAEGVAVMLFWQIGELVQDYALGKSRRSIASLIDIRPDKARLVEGDTTREVSPDDVRVGDIIRVNPGERIPLDGIVTDGHSSLDTSALTGESIPRDITIDDQALSGAVNLNGVIQLRVTSSAGESTVAKILELVENASHQKAKTEQFITKFSRYYTPIVVFIAAIVAFVIPAILGQAYSPWIYRALAFLVISCPCALVVSVPVGYFGGIGAASARGILVKGSNHLEALNNVRTMVFDKTGTLTQGIFQVRSIRALPHSSEEEILELAALAESHSNHPIALSIRRAYEAAFKPVEQGTSRIGEMAEIAGHGIRAEIDGSTVLAGNDRLFQREGIEYTVPETSATLVHVAKDGVALGSIFISDVVKEETPHALRTLHTMGVKILALLTGDRRDVASDLERQLPLDLVRYELLPQDKVSEYRALQQEHDGLTAYVGDGLNDAPVLALADLGIAMGGVGQDAAIEAADIVLMTDNLDRIPEAIFIAKETRKIVWQNIIFALGVKTLIMILAGFGYANMWAAVFADVGVTVLAILNSLRALRLSNDRKYRKHVLRYDT